MRSILPSRCERRVEIAIGSVKILQRSVAAARDTAMVRRGEPGSLVGTHVVDPEVHP